MPPKSLPIVLTTMVREDVMSTPITHAYGDIHVWKFINILEDPKRYHNLGLGSQNPTPG